MDMPEISRRDLLGGSTALAGLALLDRASVGETAQSSAWRGATPPTAIATRQVAVERDVVFGRGGARDLLCDVYRPPAGREKRVAVIHLHGGGFVRGNNKAGVRTAHPLAA